MTHTTPVDEKPSVHLSQARLLKLTMEAMMDSLTPEQQKKVAAYLIRNSRVHSFAYSRGKAGSDEKS